MDNAGHWYHLVLTAHLESFYRFIRDLGPASALTAACVTLKASDSNWKT